MSVEWLQKLQNRYNNAGGKECQRILDALANHREVSEVGSFDGSDSVFDPKDESGVYFGSMNWQKVYRDLFNEYDLTVNEVARKIRELNELTKTQIETARTGSLDEANRLYSKMICFREELDLDSVEKIFNDSLTPEQKLVLLYVERMKAIPESERYWEE